MSYEIVYAREFIKTGDGRILPLILSGSNNCWSPGKAGRWKRERSWISVYSKQGENPAITPDALMEKVKNCIPSEYQEHFVRNGKWVNDNALIRFFENGIRKAKTIEELHEELLCEEYINGCIYYYKDSNTPITIHSATIRSTPELDEFLTRVDEEILKNPEERRLYICIGFSHEDVLIRQRDLKKKKERLKGKYYVVTTGHGYVSKLTQGRIYSTAIKEYAKQFETEKSAQKWIKERGIKWRFPRLTFEVEYVV